MYDLGYSQRSLWSVLPSDNAVWSGKKWTDVPEEYIAFIFRIEEQAKKKNIKQAASFMVVSCLAYCLTLRVESIYSSDVSVDFFLNSGLWGYWHCGHSWPIVLASGDSEDDYGEADGMKIVRGNRSSRRNLPQRHFCPSQNPTWPDPVLNPGRRCGKPATNRLSYGAAIGWL
jgi:hypothetical protein